MTKQVVSAKSWLSGLLKNALKLSPTQKDKQEIDCKPRITKMYAVHTFILTQMFLVQTALNQAYLCF